MTDALVIVMEGLCLIGAGYLGAFYARTKREAEDLCTPKLLPGHVTGLSVDEKAKILQLRFQHIERSLKNVELNESDVDALLASLAEASNVVDTAPLFKGPFT